MHKRHTHFALMYLKEFFMQITQNAGKKFTGGIHSEDTTCTTVQKQIMCCCLLNIIFILFLEKMEQTMLYKVSINSY